MRWSDERYVRLYSRDTTTWLMLPWESRAIHPLILRKLDRAGILDLGADGLDGLAAVISMPIHIVEAGFPPLLQRGVYVLRDDGLLVCPNFIEAQEAAQTDRARQAAKRARDRDLAVAMKRGIDLKARAPAHDALTELDDDEEPGVTIRDGRQSVEPPGVTNRDGTVTDSHAASRAVTLCCAEPSHADLRESAPPAPPSPTREHVRKRASIGPECAAIARQVRPDLDGGAVERAWAKFAKAKAEAFTSASRMEAAWQSWIERERTSNTPGPASGPPHEESTEVLEAQARAEATRASREEASKLGQLAQRTLDRVVFARGIARSAGEQPASEDFLRRGERSLFDGDANAAPSSGTRERAAMRKAGGT